MLLSLLVTGTYIILVTIAGQAAAWWIVGLRQIRIGRIALVRLAGCSDRSGRTVIVTGRLVSVLDASPTTLVVTASPMQTVANPLLGSPTGLLLALTGVAYWPWACERVPGHFVPRACCPDLTTREPSARRASATESARCLPWIGQTCGDRHPCAGGSTSSACFPGWSRPWSESAGLIYLSYRRLSPRCRHALRSQCLLPRLVRRTLAYLTPTSAEDRFFVRTATVLEVGLVTVTIATAAGAAWARGSRWPDSGAGDTLRRHFGRGMGHSNLHATVHQRGRTEPTCGAAGYPCPAWSDGGLFRPPRRWFHRLGLAFVVMARLGDPVLPLILTTASCCCPSAR